MSRKNKTEKISYEPIPCEDGEGFICLSVYPPGGFINNANFSVFIGGVGAGDAKTLEEAESLLFQLAREDCERRVKRALATAMHYNQAQARLSLVRLKSEEK